MVATTSACHQFDTLWATVSTFESNFYSLLNILRSLEAHHKGVPLNHPGRNEDEEEEKSTENSVSVFSVQIDSILTDVIDTTVSDMRKSLSDAYTTMSPNLSSGTQRHPPECQVSNYTSVNELEFKIDVDALPPALQSRWPRNGQRSSFTTRLGLDMEMTVTTDRARNPVEFKLHERWKDLYVANDEAGDDTDKNDNDDTYFTGRHGLRVKSYVSHDAVIGKCCTRDVLIHPFHTVRVTWNTIGMVLILVDIFLIPLSAAWGLEINQSVCIARVVFWVLDIIMTFNTGIIEQSGNLISIRKVVVMHYLCTWFFFDIAIAFAELITILLAEITASRHSLAFVSNVRCIRLFRASRGLRLLKFKYLGQTISVVFTHKEVPRLMLAILKTQLAFLILAHIFACLWYWIGWQGKCNGGPSWLLIAPHLGGLVDEYAQSLLWTLGYLTGNAVESSVEPQNTQERIFMIATLLVSMIVIGCVVGKMTETIVQLYNINSESYRTRRSLEKFLKANKIPAELSTRILRFAARRLEQESRTTLDTAADRLLSDHLNSELIFFQRRNVVVTHPLFFFIERNYTRQVTVQICKEFTSCMFSEDQVVFTATTWAEALVITRQGGNWLLQRSEGFDPQWIREEIGESFTQDIIRMDSKPNEGTRYTDSTWFAEYSLYTTATHQNTLIALTIGEAYELTGQGFANAVKRSPSCLEFVYHYALAYLEHAKSLIAVSDFTPLTVNHTAIATANNPIKRAPTKSWGSEFDQFNSLSSTSAQRNAFMVKIYHRQVTTTEIRDCLKWLFPEFNTGGSYATYDHPDECKRCMCAVLAVIYVHYNSFEEFVMNQSATSCMTYDIWEKMQKFYSWTGLDEDRFCAVLVLLAIRGLGKIESFAKLLPAHRRNPESIVVYLLRSRPDCVPSSNSLCDEMRNIVTGILSIHSHFNMAQMLQGESNPNELAVLRHHVDREGWDRLKCYVVALLGVMSALRGAEFFHSSIYMDRHNGTTMLQGLHCLQNLEHVGPATIYWTYISLRAKHIGLPFSQSLDFVLARLACLTRARRQDCPNLAKDWELLSQSDKRTLMRHFLADGIYEHTILFAYLPAYLVNARNNPRIGLTRALTLLAELIYVIRAMGVSSESTNNTTFADIQSLAAFCLDVKNSLAFEAVGGHISFVQQGDVLKATISKKMYLRIKGSFWQEDASQDKEMAYCLRRVLRKTNEHEELLTQILHRSEGMLSL